MDANNVDNSSTHEVISPGINLNDYTAYVDPNVMLSNPVSNMSLKMSSSATQMPTK